MIINHQHRFIYVAAPRTASTSMRSWLASLPATDVTEDPHCMSVPATLRGYFVFGTLRHPAERLLSLWRYHVRNDIDARSLDRYLADLPGMHTFHARSQMHRYAEATAGVLVPVTDTLERDVCRVLAAHCEHAPQFADRLPRLNGTTAEITGVPDAVTAWVATHWPEDCRAWQQCGGRPLTLDFNWT